MTPARQANRELDALIEEITIDCYAADEQLQGFENAFDEYASFPRPGTVVGEEVEVLHVGQANNRRELIATCQRNELALLDIDIKADPDTSRLIAAYRRWIRA
ncbi:MAG: hypothetical protein WBP81_02720 [Solirubrobacteraceae bacterium]